MQQSQNSLTWSLFVQGKVQNVGYRRFVQRAALMWKLTGWTRNRQDGQVEVRVTGDQQTLELFLADLRRGPPGSLVRSLSYEATPYERSSDFLILPDL